MLNVLTDIGLIFIAYFVSISLRFDLLNGIVSVHMRDARFVAVAFFYSIAVVIVYAFCHLYTPKRFQRIGQDDLRIIIINGIGSLALLAVFFIFRIIDVSRGAIFLFWIISSAFVIIKRTIVYSILQYARKKGYNLKHVIVIGNGVLAKQYIAEIKRNPQLGICVDGYVSAVSKPELGRPLGSYEELETILASNDFDGLIVALEPHEIRFMTEVLGVADKEGIHIEMIPFYNDYYPVHPTVETVGNIKLFNLRATPMESVFNAVTKRIFDIVASGFLIILTSPIMLITAIGVKLSSPGPIIFKQDRVGRDKKIFKMLKFRSMRVTGTEDTGWTTNEDNRKTKFGSFIRKFSIDEFPQFFNVFIGQMSLVGPRPELPYHVNHYKEEIPRYLIRQQVRPGMTGWAQVNGLRGDTSITKRVEYDIWYIENWTFGLDLRIIFLTVFGGMVNNETIVQ